MGKLKIISSTGAKVYINNTDTGVIKREIKEFELENGTHEIYAKSAWCGSPKIQVTITDENAPTLILDGFKNETVIKIVFMALAGMFVFTKNLIFGIIAGIVFLYPLYYLTIGKDNYLQLSEKKDVLVKKE